MKYTAITHTIKNNKKIVCKKTKFILSALVITMAIFMMTTKVNAQKTVLKTVSLDETQIYWNEFEKFFEVPNDYQFHSVSKVKADNFSAYLFRFEKQENNGLGGEYFSFLISENKQILGFTNMDKKYANLKMLSKSENEKTAKEFLLKIDKSLANDLKNLWTERHDEEIIINGQKIILAGMKYKCYRSSQNDYAWVIVGFDGSVMTFERNIKWNNVAHKRITEKWLHDSWLKEQQISVGSEEDILKKMVEETFANGALNKLNTKAMRNGFHPDFAILIAKEDKLNRLFLNDWMEVVEQYKNSEEQVNSGVRNLEYTIDVLEITGKTAIVKTQFFRNNEIAITDYLSYIKFPNGWKAVGKISHEHIPNPLNLKF